MNVRPTRCPHLPRPHPLTQRYCWCLGDRLLGSNWDQLPTEPGRLARRGLTLSGPAGISCSACQLDSPTATTAQQPLPYLKSACSCWRGTLWAAGSGRCVLDSPAAAATRRDAETCTYRYPRARLRLHLQSSHQQLQLGHTKALSILASRGQDGRSQCPPPAAAAFPSWH